MRCGDPVAAAGGDLQARRVGVQLVAGLGPEGDEHNGMVAQALSHSGQLMDLRDSYCRQLAGRADARQQQDVGRADTAAAQDDFARLDDEGFVP